jgi:hypothetical protein
MDTNQKEGTWRSPNEMFDAAKTMMLDGREPIDERDWELIVNFLAANVHPDVATAAVPLVCMLFDCPLRKQTIQDIVAFQRREQLSRSE